VLPVDAAARLRAACAVWIGLWSLGLFMNNLVGPLISPDRPLDDAWPYPASPVAALVILVSLALFIHLRPAAKVDVTSADDRSAEAARPIDADGAVRPSLARRVSARRVLDLALGYEVFLAAGIGLVNQWTPNTIGLSWICALILVHPLIVPDSPGRTLVAALGAASMDPLGMVVTAARGVPLPPVSALVWAVLPNYICAFLAVLPAQLVGRLSRELSSARELGSYRLGEKLGGGGMGEVYRAEHRLLARPAAIKLIRPQLLGRKSPAERHRIVRRFEREAQVIALLRSPHTIDLYDYGVTEDGTLYYVMQLLDGSDLDTLVNRFGPVSAERAVYLLRQVCDSLAEAHQEGLVHRDVKPANIFVGHHGRAADFVTVLDFGLVKTLESEPGDAMLTGHHSLTGTPAYMAPEQALGEPVDARSDVYAIGCLAYFLLTGNDVFEGRTAMEVVSRHVRDAPVPPSARSEQAIPQPLDELVLACLDKDPDQRPQDAEALSCQLAQAVEGCAWTPEDARRWWADALASPHPDGDDAAPTATSA
jgi:serine/threonine-protein kinase